MRTILCLMATVALAPIARAQHYSDSPVMNQMKLNDQIVQDNIKKAKPQGEGCNSRDI
jgi:hypothetical protein